MSKTILIVEDDPLLREVYQTIVKKAGFSVLLAGHGLQAIDLFQNNVEEIDVVLADINMPLMKGTELTDHLRNLKPEIKIIYMSGFVHGVEVAGELLQAREVVLQKPFAAQLLLGTIREVLDGNLKSGLR